MDECVMLDAVLDSILWSYILELCWLLPDRMIIKKGLVPFLILLEQKVNLAIRVQMMQKFGMKVDIFSFLLLWLKNLSDGKCYFYCFGEHIHFGTELSGVSCQSRKWLLTCGVTSKYCRKYFNKKKVDTQVLSLKLSIVVCFVARRR